MKKVPLKQLRQLLVGQQLGDDVAQLLGGGLQLQGLREEEGLMCLQLQFQVPQAIHWGAVVCQVEDLDDGGDLLVHGHVGHQSEDITKLI